MLRRGFLRAAFALPAAGSSAGGVAGSLKIANLAYRQRGAGRSGGQSLTWI